VSNHLGSELRHSKYRLLGLVGQGQFGRVFCAVHRQTGKLVALKNLERERFPTNKFLRELRILLSLQHPNIVTCQALEQTATGRCLVMDYCEGGTLRSLMQEDVRLSLPQSLKLVADILAGLAHAHERGVVHCDIKPENILLNVIQTGWDARISDFGIARISQELNNQDFGNTGSPAYMAPERFYGQYSLTSDLYSVGVLLFELLAGHRPFSGTPTELMSAHLNRPVQFPESISSVWHPFLTKALRKLSARRFQSAGEMLAALQIAAVEASGFWLDQQTAHQPLLQPTPSPFTSRLFPKHQVSLESPLTALAAIQPIPQPIADAAVPAPIYLYYAEKQQIVVQIVEWQDSGTVGLESLPSQAFLGGSFSSQKWQIAFQNVPVKAIVPCPQGCFVVTQTSLHLLPLPNDAAAALTSPPIFEFSQNSLVAIDPQGRWMTLLTINAELAEGLLTFHALSGDAPTLSPDPIRLPLEGYELSSLQLLALDGGHVAVVAESLLPRQGLPHRQDRSAHPKNFAAKNFAGTLMQVFTRRGTSVGTLNLPVRVGKLTRTSTPYQLMAVDRQDPHSVLLIDLKPYRISRLGVNVQPSYLISTAWGYLLADQQGEIVALDREGRHSGQLQAECPITATAFVSPHHLFVATWQEQQGYLYVVDLREANLDILF
jgi:serine/threonine protein kinase